MSRRAMATPMRRRGDILRRNPAWPWVLLVLAFVWFCAHQAAKIQDRIDAQQSAYACATSQALSDGDMVACYTSRGLPAPGDL